MCRKKRWKGKKSKAYSTSQLEFRRQQELAGGKKETQVSQKKEVFRLRVF
jgi:hypothetical protein